MPIDWAPFVDLVRRHRRFLLTTHVRPDGDGLGSALALAEVLQGQGKEVRVLIASTFPPRYDFLLTLGRQTERGLQHPPRRIERFQSPGDAWRDTDAVLILDTGTWNQLGEFGPFLKTLPAPRMVIDHHLTQDNLGGVALVDTSAEATGRLIFEAIGALGAPVTETAANLLFVALAMDTGWFRHSNTTDRTFALAEELVRSGACPTVLYEHLFEQNTLPRLKLVGLVLDRLQVIEGGRVAFSEIHRTDYQLTGALPQDTEDLINYPRSLAGVEVALFFMEQPRGGVKVSFRSRAQVDVARLAERFGGGGHCRASGAIVEGTLEEARRRILEAVHTALESPLDPAP
jgi:phosphoesterase RecJ-like protein